MKDFECPICGGTDFENLDRIRDPRVWIEQEFLDYRNPVIGFCACKKCGHFTYNNDRDLTTHYRDTYRKVVSEKNIITCNRKFEYHKAFLMNLFEPEANKRVIDFGCAYGHNLNMLRGMGCDVKGYELTKGFVNYGRNAFGLEISDGEFDEPDDSVDLIICYHVLEHLPDPVQTLEKFKRALKPDGLIYLATPMWFECLDEAGGGTTADFENLYHLDHVQVFSREGLFNTIRAAGLSLVQMDDQIYGLTVGLKKDGAAHENWSAEFVHEDWQPKLHVLEKQREAMRLFREAAGKGQPGWPEFQKACEAYPDYPDAWLHFSEVAMENIENKMQILSKALELCSQKWKILNAIAAVHLAWDQDRQKGGTRYTNNVKKAEEIYIQLFRFKPGNEQSLWSLGLIEHHYKQDHKKAADLWSELLKINPTRYSEIIRMIGVAASEDWPVVEEKEPEAAKK